MNEKVRTYLEALVPKNIPNKNRQELFDEYISHIYDKIDFYTEVGYDKDTATEKALSEMGNTKELKEEIKLSFEALYKERTLFAVLTGAAVFIMNLIFGSLGYWVMSADSNGKPEAGGVFISFLSVVAVLSLVSFLYIKGYRKSLIAVGISNLIIGATLLICFYPQCFIYGLTVSVEYILELFTPLILCEFNLYNSEIITAEGSLFFTLALAVFCFIASRKIRKKGLPDKGAKNIAGAVISIVLVLGLVAVIPYEKAEKYFVEYPVWFQIAHDDIRKEEQLIFDSFDENTTYEEARKHLVSEDYIDTESYMNTLSKNMKEQFADNLKDMNITFNGHYELFFCKDYIENNIGEYKKYGNSFVAIGKNSSGMLSFKGIGSLSNDNKADKFGSHRHYGLRQDDIKKCQDYFFNKLKKGDSKEAVLSFFGGEQGEIYARITEYTEGSRLEFVKVYVNGYIDKTEVKDYTAFLEFTFENDTLSYAHMTAEYFDGSEFTEKTYVIK